MARNSHGERDSSHSQSNVIRYDNRVRMFFKKSAVTGYIADMAVSVDNTINN